MNIISVIAVQSPPRSCRDKKWDDVTQVRRGDGWKNVDQKNGCH